MSKSNIISDLCDYFYDFVDPFIKEYLKDISQNRIIVKTKSGSFEEYKNDFDEYDFRKKMMENAFNSQNFKKFYDKITKDYGIKNKEIRLFDTLFIVNITEDLKHALSLCLMLSSFDPENYAEIIRSDRFPFASHLKQLYHMTLDSQHEVEIVVKTEKIVTNVNYIALNKEKISIEILNDGSYSKVKFKAIDNMKDKQLNPLRIVKIFFALISILKDNINYEFWISIILVDVLTL